MGEPPRLTRTFWLLSGAATLPFFITLVIEEVSRWLMRPGGSAYGYLILLPSVVVGALILDRVPMAPRTRVAVLAVYLFAMPLLLIGYLVAFSGFVYKRLF